MQEQNQMQHINTNAQGVPTFFIPNVPQSVTKIQPNQQILLSQQSNFMRMPISSVGQWTVNNVLTSGALANDINHQLQTLQAPRIVFTQSASNDHFIMPNRPILSNQATIGINQRFIPAHSLVVTQQIPNQIKQISVTPSSIQIPIQNHNITNLTPIPRLTTANLCSKPEILINNVLNTNIINDKLHSNDVSNTENTAHIDPKFQNSVSPINYKRLLELSHGLDPLLQLDDDVQEIFNSFLEDFLFHITDKAIELVKLRKSSTLEVKDFQYIFEHDWNIFVPGYQTQLEKPKKSTECEIHKLRMTLIKKQCKK